jgi:hypothetical protein
MHLLTWVGFGLLGYVPNTYINPLSRIHNTCLISAYFGLDSRECKCLVLRSVFKYISAFADSSLQSDLRVQAPAVPPLRTRRASRLQRSRRRRRRQQRPRRHQRPRSARHGACPTLPRPRRLRSRQTTPAQTTTQRKSSDMHSPMSRGSRLVLFLFDSEYVKNWQICLPHLIVYFL